MSRVLTKKQKGFVEDYVKTGNGTKAALKHYDIDPTLSPERIEKNAGVISAQNLGKLSVQNAILEALPDDLLARVHKEGLEATRDDEPDYGVRHKYLDTAYKLKGSYVAEPEAKTGNTYNMFFMPQAQEQVKAFEDNMKKLLQGNHENTPNS